MTSPRDWYAARVWSGRERFACQQLKLSGYEVLLPSYSERRRWSDRMKRVERPFFPGYLFCWLQREDFSAVARTPGVLCILGNGNGPLPIPAEEMRSITKVAESKMSPRLCCPAAEGQVVRVIRGPLMGAAGTVIRRDRGRSDLIVAITLLNRAVAVEFDAACLEQVINETDGEPQPGVGRAACVSRRNIL